MGGGAEGAAEVLVDAGEDVCRLCFSADIPISRDSKHPNQIDVETGLLLLEEIGWDDVSQRGFSLQRKHLFSYAEALKEADRRDKKKSQKHGAAVGYELAGTLITRVETINAIENPEGQQIFRVLATPTKELPGHAEVRVFEYVPKHLFLKFRKDLRDALGRLLPGEAIDATVEAG